LKQILEKILFSSYTLIFLLPRFLLFHFITHFFSKTPYKKIEMIF
tara:strand:+ start:1237 stop:1371 length:135 start_codon:yes stop_codon:yes gene_type:complete